LTVRAKVVDAFLLARLKTELIAPATLQYVTEALGRELNRRIDERPRLIAEAQIARERSAEKLQRLVEAIENGVPPASVAQAITDRQAELASLDTSLAELNGPLHQRLAVMPAWVRQQLEDIVGLLTESPERTKNEFQRMGLRVTMMPMVGENARPYYQADVVNSLACVAGITEIRDLSPSAVDRSDLPEAL
jgi:hypothetical protein